MRPLPPNCAATAVGQRTDKQTREMSESKKFEIAGQLGVRLANSNEPQAKRANRGSGMAALLVAQRESTSTFSAREASASRPDMNRIVGIASHLNISLAGPTANDTQQSFEVETLTGLPTVLQRTLPLSRARAPIDDEDFDVDADNLCLASAKSVSAYRFLFSPDSDVTTTSRQAVLDVAGDVVSTSSSSTSSGDAQMMNKPVICRLGGLACGKVQFYVKRDGSSARTTELLKHLKAQHMEAFNACDRLARASTDTASRHARNQALAAVEAERAVRKKAIGGGLSNWISHGAVAKLKQRLLSFLGCIQADFPFSAMGRSSAFRALFNSLNARLCNRNDASTWLLAMASAYVNELQFEKMAKEPMTCVAVTADALTRNSQTYVAFTMHYVSSNWELETMQHACYPLPGREVTSELYAALVRNVYDSLPESTVVTSITTDNAANFQRLRFLAMGALAPDDPTPVSSTHASATGIDGNDVAGSRGGVPCVAHTLQLTMSAVLGSDKYAKLVDIVHANVHVWRNSLLLSRLLLKEQRGQLVGNHKGPVTLIADVATRWCSFYQCASRFFELMGPMARALFRASSSFPELEPSDAKCVRDATELFPDAEVYEMIKAVVDIFAPIANAINFLEGENYVTIAYVPRIVYDLVDGLRQKAADASPSSVTHDVAKTVLKDVKSRLGWWYEDVNQALVTALFVPTLASLNFVSHRLRDKVIDAAAVLLVSTSEELIDNREMRRAISSESTSMQPTMAGGKLALAESESFLHKWFEWVIEQKGRFVSEHNSNVLSFWKQNEPKHPEALSYLIRSMCAIQATSASSEREFSAVSIVLDGGRRASFKPENIDRIIRVRNFTRKLDEQGITSFAEKLAERILVRRNSDSQEWYEFSNAAADEADDVAVVNLEPT